MDHFSSCANGHRWPTPEIGGAVSPQPFCPVCGAAAHPETIIQALDTPAVRSPDAEAPSPVAPAGAASSQTLPLPEGFRPRASSPWPETPGYEIVEELGRGGMGVVYRARQLALKRDVALKMILAGGHAGPGELLRFANEAEAIARLDHPNIVQIYEVGEADGRPFIALEYLEGGSLAAKLAGQPQPPREAARMICMLADAVEFAHRGGIVHRDLKPMNVLFDRHGAMKITDFGLAKQLQGDSAGTRTGDVMGTPAYMAPEQAGGATKQLGPACDVYALGVMLYEMLTGRPPFYGRDSVDTLLAVVSEEPLPPRRLAARIPRDLETICLKCLEKSPARRFASAGELAADLRRFSNNEPILARPPGALERAVKWSRRHPARAIAGAAAGLLLAASIGGFAWHASTLSRQLAETERQRQRAEADLDLALDTVDELVERLSGENLASLPKTDPIRRDFLEITLGFCQGLLRQNPGEPGVRWRMGRARRQTAGIQQIFGRTDEAEEQYKQAIRELDQLTAEFPERQEYRRDLAATHNNLGNLLRSAGRAAAAEDEYRIAQKAFRQLCDESPDDADFRQQLAASWNNLGLARLAAGDAAGAEEAEDRALSLYRELEQRRPDAPEIVQALAGSYGNVGGLYKATGRLDQALAAFREAGSRLRRLHEQTPAKADFRLLLASNENNLAALLSARGDAKSADAAYAAAIEMLDGLAAEFPEIPAYRQRLADALNNRALLLAYSGRGPEARGSFDRARELCERDPAATASLANRETLAVSSFGLGMLAAEAGDLPQAEQWLKSCREARQELVKRQPDRPDYYPQLAMTYDYAAELARRRQDARAALANEEDAVRTQRRAVELAPQMARYHAPLLLYVKTLVADRLQQGEIAQAVQEAERLAETLPDQAEACRTAAELLAQCLTAAKASAPDGFDAEQVALRAVALLRQAAKLGGLSAAAFKETDAFAPLAPRDDFQELVRGVEDEGQ